VEARDRLESGIELTYYLPRAALDEGDRVLVVDDLVRSGETQTLLLDIADRAGATVVGVAALIAAGDEGLARARDRVDAPVAALVALD
jgi:adenine phosphoribosyltransferase